MTNNKRKELLKFGLSKTSISKLNEHQINLLHSRLISENETTGVLKVPANSDAEKIAQREKRPYMTYEGEMTEKKKGKDKNNPWAICTSQMADEFGTSKRSDWTKAQKRKYERCVKDVKKTMNEDLMIEKFIVEMVKKEIKPSIKKKDLESYIKGKKSETMEQEIAPAPPKTKPDVKPGITTPKPDKKNPFKPKHKPNPKAGQEPKSSLPSWLRYGSIFNK